jgi:acyl-CoA thioesterase
MTTESLVTLGTLRENSLPRYHDATVPFVPPIEDCVEAVNPAGDVGIMTVADLRLDPDCAKWWFGEAVEKGELRGWLRLNDDSGAHWDAWSVLFASDVLPPATFPLGSSGWVPTLQLSSYVRAVPASEWLRVRQWCVVIEDGLVDEQCELFDDQGHLVASSKQLAMVRFHESS